MAGRDTSCLCNAIELAQSAHDDNVPAASEFAELEAGAVVSGHSQGQFRLTTPQSVERGAEQLGLSLQR